MSLVLSLAELREMKASGTHESSPFCADFGKKTPRFGVAVPYLDREGWPALEGGKLRLEWRLFPTEDALYMWDFGSWVVGGSRRVRHVEPVEPNHFLESGAVNPQWVWWTYWVENRTLVETADEIGLSVGALQQRFRRWQFPRRPQGAGGRGRTAKLTDQQIREIKDRGVNSECDSRAELAVEFGVSRQRIYQILNGQHRRLTE